MKYHHRRCARQTGTGKSDGKKRREIPSFWFSCFSCPTWISCPSFSAAEADKKNNNNNKKKKKKTPSRREKTDCKFRQSVTTERKKENAAKGSIRRAGRKHSLLETRSNVFDALCRRRGAAKEKEKTIKWPDCFSQRAHFAHLQWMLVKALQSSSLFVHGPFCAQVCLPKCRRDCYKNAPLSETYVLLYRYSPNPGLAAAAVMWQ